MKVSIQSVKELRERTNAGVLDCNQVLSEVGGDIERAVEVLRQRGVATAEKKKHAIATEGIIEAYVHHTRHIGALVELNCETDFVARTDEFKELARNLAMQVAAACPQFITAEDLPPETELDPQIACLLSQPFIKDPSRTVKDVIVEAIAKVGENIQVRRFARFELGVDH
jgi:elongation factor Ts